LQRSVVLCVQKEVRESRDGEPCGGHLQRLGSVGKIRQEWAGLITAAHNIISDLTATLTD
jgi:hypothetical protein